MSGLPKLFKRMKRDSGCDDPKFMTRRGLLSILPLALRSQEKADIRTTVRLVLIPTSVMDRRGTPVEGLEENDFAVAVDGRTVRHRLELETQPLALVVGVQVSSSATDALAKITEAASIIPPLVTGERGEVSLISYAGSVRVEHEFTSDADRFLRSIRQLRPLGENSRQLDAAAEAVKALASRERARRRVLLLLGERWDSGSETPLADVIRNAGFANVMAYGATFSAFNTAWTARRHEAGTRENDLIPLVRGLGRLGKKSTMEALTEATGGMTTQFTKQSGLETALSKVGEDLHSQYLLAFESSGEGEAKFRNIQVRIPAKPDVVVRARPGYWGP